jgi:hypothetical protein
MNIKFITFGSHDNYIDAGKRLVRQSTEMNIFTETILYTPDYLKTNLEFWNQHDKFVKNNTRGYAYWLWKPFIIKKTLETMNNNDILLYLDCGCELSSNKKNNLLDAFHRVKKDKFIGASTGYPENMWNKMDVIKKIILNDTYSTTPQIQGAQLLFLVCDEIRELVNEWYTLCCDYHNIDDSPSIIPNAPCFREHRHDQSIFSLLTKKYNLFSNYDLNNCVYHNRNKTGVSQIGN